MTITLTGYLVTCTALAALITLVDDAFFTEERKTKLSADFLLLLASLLAIGGVITLLWNYFVG